MIRRLLVVLLGLATLTACTSIPTSGPVETIPVTAQPRGVEIAPEPPQAGITPARLVEGFLQAMADPEGGYAIARQYLSEGARKAWNPDAGAVVYEGVLAGQAENVGVQGTSLGRIDGFGRFTAVRDELVVDFGLVREGDEWRIGRPMEGVLVSKYIFDRYYAHATTYFLAKSGDYVVPDLLHFPEALLTASRIVEAQIAGPSEQLRSAVRNAVPLGTTLGPDSATVGPDGTARISLVGIPASLSEERRRELGVQLLWSLTAIPRTTGLAVADGSGLAIPLPGQNVDGVLELSGQQGYQALSSALATELFGIREGQAGRVTSAGTFIAVRSAGLSVRDVAVSLDGNLVAFVDDTRRMVLIGLMGGELNPVVPGLTDLRAAQFSKGMVWLLGTDDQGADRILRVDAQGKASIVTPADVPGRILDFSVSQTGVRMAMVVATAEGAEVGFGVVGPGSAPTLTQWRPLHLTGPTGSPLSNFVGVDWSGETELAVIAESGGVRSVFLTQLDGSEVNDLGPVGLVPVALAALPRLGGDAIVVRSADGEVARYEARSRWVRLEEDLGEVTYPG